MGLQTFPPPPAFPCANVPAAAIPVYLQPLPPPGGVASGSLQPPPPLPPPPLPPLQVTAIFSDDDDDEYEDDDDDDDKVENEGENERKTGAGPRGAGTVVLGGLVGPDVGPGAGGRWMPMERGPAVGDAAGARTTVQSAAEAAGAAALSHQQQQPAAAQAFGSGIFAKRPLEEGASCEP